jgi:hypothetical protein
VKLDCTSASEDRADDEEGCYLIPGAPLEEPKPHVLLRGKPTGKGTLLFWGHACQFSYGFPSCPIINTEYIRPQADCGQEKLHNTAEAVVIFLLEGRQQSSCLGGWERSGRGIHTGVPLPDVRI